MVNLFCVVGFITLVAMLFYPILWGLLALCIMGVIYFW